MEHNLSGRSVVVAGATGLVGKAILESLLADRTVLAVHSLGRRPQAIHHPKLTGHVVDFAALPALPPIDEVFLALGTTIKAAGSEAAFHAVDYDANLAVAVSARAAGAKKAGLVSAMGADPGSKVFYSRTKGQLEAAMRQMQFERLVVARPSLLIGNRQALGQAARRGEEWGLAIGKALGFLLPADYRPIDAGAVACALVSAVPRDEGEEIMLSDALRREAFRFQKEGICA